MNERKSSNRGGQIRHPNATYGTREGRRKEAERLAIEREERSAEEQLKVLDYRLGKGKGAVKERKRLAKQLQAS